MKVSFTTMMGAIPRGMRTAADVSAAGVSVKKERRSALSSSDQIKLSRNAREGGSEVFTFFETDGSIGSDFRTVYNLHMRIEALSKALTFFDMRDVFQIVPENTVAQIRAQLQHLFQCQQDLATTSTALLADSTNAALLDAKTAAEAAEQVASIDLDAIDIEASDLFKSLEKNDEMTVKKINA